jgi:hypothetical protein
MCSIFNAKGKGTVVVCVKFKTTSYKIIFTLPIKNVAELAL